jgi:acyl-CoA synthetase (AMP-forming)/AMP-acid ligase II
MNIAELFRATVESRGEAIIAFRKRGATAQSVAGLEHEAAAFAARLQAAGLQPGDAVLVFYPMSVELYVALLALFQLGLVAMFIDPSAGQDHIERCCELHPPQALIASPKAHLLRFVSPALRRIPHKFVLGLPCLRPLPQEQARIVAVADDHPALLTFTSGSTGEPKAALRTHGFLQAQHRVLEKSLALTPGEIDLTTLPIFVIANLASGVRSVIPGTDLRFPGAIDPAPVVRQIELMQPVSTAASPAFLERLADYCLLRQIQLTSFQKIFTGGAPVFPRVLDKLQTIAPHAKIVAVYGSTEAEPIAEIACDEISEDDRNAMLQGRGLLAGKPVPEIQLRILCDQWGKPLAPLTAAEFAANCRAINEPGEIVVTGEHVLTGYLHGRGDEETKFKVDGQVWHRTGDVGYVDTEGRLWLLGRCAAKINDAHGTLYPFAVECAASHHPHSRRAALVQHKGRRLLVVELSAQKNNLNGLQKTLAWAHLDEIRIVNSIPVDKRHNAKVDYPALSKLLS